MGRLAMPMAKLTPDQLRTRERVESVIRLVAPGLNLVLAVGERVSRIVEPDDPEYYPARVEGADVPPIVGARPVGRE
jgi:hypothetical protein